MSLDLEEDELKKIEVKSLKGQRKASVIINNFYSLITIVIMSIVIIWYVNYILPQQKINKQKQLKKEQYQEYLQEQRAKREAQIKLSVRLNKKSKDKNGTK